MAKGFFENFVDHPWEFRGHLQQNLFSKTFWKVLGPWRKPWQMQVKLQLALAGMLVTFFPMFSCPELFHNLVGHPWEFKTPPAAKPVCKNFSKALGP